MLLIWNVNPHLVTKTNFPGLQWDLLLKRHHPPNLKLFFAQIFRDCNWNTTYLDNPRYTSYMTLTYPIVYPYVYICTYTCPYFKLTFIVVTYTVYLQVHRKKPSPGLHVSHVGAQLAMNILQPQKPGGGRKDSFWKPNSMKKLVRLQKAKQQKRTWWLRNRWCGWRLVCCWWFEDWWCGLMVQWFKWFLENSRKRQLIENQLRFSRMPRQQIDVMLFWKSWKERIVKICHEWNMLMAAISPAFGRYIEFRTTKRLQQMDLLDEFGGKFFLSRMPCWWMDGVVQWTIGMASYVMHFSSGVLAVVEIWTM